MKSEFEIAITQLSADRNLSPEIIIEAIEAALVTAYKKNYSDSEHVRVELDRHTGAAQVFLGRVIAADPGDDDTLISLAEARKTKPDAVLGEIIEIETKPRNFGRIAAQTAKQVITQRIREAERDSVYLEYADRVGELVNGIVRNIDGRSSNVVISMGKAEALLMRNDQIPGEHYRFNQRLRVLITGVERQGRGPQIIVSRSNRDLLRRLLELEVPEILNGTVEVKGIAREPGARSKVAVAALQAGVDPVGSCVGIRGVRIQNIVNELNGEKIDVVEWDADLQTYIANALSPARVIQVYLNELEQTAKVVVPDRALSLAIGKEGQNARLAAKLTGWRIDIKSETEAADEAEELAREMEEAAAKAREIEAARQAAAELLAKAEAALEEETPAEVAETETEPETPATEAVEEAETVDIAEPEAVEPVEPVAETVEEPAAVDEPAEEAVEQEAVESEADEAEAVEPEAEEAPAPEQEPAAEPTDFDTWEEEETSDDEDDEEAKARKRKGRTLEFDERLGRVVSRKRRKPSRRSNDWEDWDE